MTLSLIGGHFTKNGLGAGYPSRVCLSIEGNGLGEQHADTITVFRDVTVYNDGPPDLHTHPQRRSIEYAKWWYQDIREIEDKPCLREAWQANAHRVNYFVITNELGGSDAEHIKDHIAYEANICQLAFADGLRCAVGKLAGDSPTWPQKETLYTKAKNLIKRVVGRQAAAPANLWQELYAPHIVEMWDKYGAIYARHVYGGDLVDGNGNPTNDPPGNPQRPFLEADYLRSIGYGGGMVLAECGIDGGYGLAEYGRFKQQILGYEAALRPYADIVIGLCWWMCGDDSDDSGEGFDADYTTYLKQIRPYLDTSFKKWEGRENMSESTEEKIYDLSQSWAFPVNEEAALQKAALADGFTPSGEEQWHTVDGTRYAMQPFYKIGSTNDKRSYFAVVGQWGDVHMFPEEELPPEPEPPYIVIPPLNQRDTRWTNKLCGTGPKTIGNWGCLLTAYTMLARHWGINNGRLVDAENDYYVSKAGFSGSNLVSMAMSKVYSQVKNEGWLNRDNANMNTKTRDYLSRGIPVPARVDFNPVTSQWDQHWVLLVGIDGDDYLMNDPWTGLQGVKVSDYYNVSGNDVLECIYYYLDNSSPPPSGNKINLAKYFQGNGQQYQRLFEVETKVNGASRGQQRHQLQIQNGRIYFTKGGDGTAVKAQWEELRIYNGFIQRWRDFSFSATDWYEAGGTWINWMPVSMAVGEVFMSQAAISHFSKANCQKWSGPTNTTDYLKLAAAHGTYNGYNGIALNDVIEVHWSKSPGFEAIEEIYFFSADIDAPGLCGWKNTRDGRDARPSELHQSGQRPNSVMDAPGCLSKPPMGVW